MKKWWFACLAAACSALHATVFFTPPMISTHLQAYTDEEKEAIERDLAAIRTLCFSEALPPSHRQPPFYLATAGAPGARKTTILERFIDEHPEYQGAVYLDPDPRTLKFMLNTYYSQSLNAYEIARAEDYPSLVKSAYDKWRPASNYIALTLLEEAFAEHQSIAHGATSTGEHISSFLPKVKEAGYRIALLLCSCEDLLRKEAISYRNEVVGFYQSSPEDALAKGKFFPQRMETYFAGADELYLFWSDALFSDECLAATVLHGRLRIEDEQAFDRFARKYEADREVLKREGISLLSFEEILAKYTER